MGEGSAARLRGNCELTLVRNVEKQRIRTVENDDISQDLGSVQCVLQMFSIILLTTFSVEYHHDVTDLLTLTLFAICNVSNQNHITYNRKYMVIYVKYTHGCIHIQKHRHTNIYINIYAHICIYKNEGLETHSGQEVKCRL